MGRLTKDAWAKATLKTEEVEVPELGGSVMVRELPASYVAAINQRIEVKQVGREQISTVDLETMNRLKFAHGVIDDDGEPMFSEDEAAGVMEKHGSAFTRIVDAIDGLSELGEAGRDAADRRFPGSGIRQNGSPVSDQAASGSGGSAVPARTGPGIQDAEG